LLSATQFAIVYVGLQSRVLLLSRIYAAMTRDQTIRALRIAVSSTCLVIGLMLVALWVRSYRSVDHVPWYPRRGYTGRFRFDTQWAIRK
jgi:hypothetical protein